MKHKNSKKFSEYITANESLTNELHEEDESEQSEMDVDCDLDASATDSDEDEFDESEQSEMEVDCGIDATATDSDEEKNGAECENGIETKTKTRAEVIKEEYLQKYKERQGKQLYVRFPHKLPETQEALEENVKKLSNLVVKVHKPRQRHARFCLVDFATNEDRNLALKKLKDDIKKGVLNKYVVNIPLTESKDLVNELAERKLKSIENKRAKNRLKKATKKALLEKNFTSSIIVLNLPNTTSHAQLRELFPNAIDIQIKIGKGKNRDKCIGAITLPSTLDARKATKSNILLGANKLLIKFDNQKMKKKFKPKINSTTDEKTINSEFEHKTKKPRMESTDNAKVHSEKGKKKKNKSSTKNKKA